MKQKCPEPVESPGCLATPVEQRCEQNGELIPSPSHDASSAQRYLALRYAFAQILFLQAPASCVHSLRDVTVPPPRWPRQVIAAALLLAGGAMQ
jgi:hypothetical protein